MNQDTFQYVLKKRIAQITNPQEILHEINDINNIKIVSKLFYALTKEIINNGVRLVKSIFNKISDDIKIIVKVKKSIANYFCLNNIRDEIYVWNGNSGYMKIIKKLMKETFSRNFIEFKKKIDLSENDKKYIIYAKGEDIKYSGLIKSLVSGDSFLSRTPKIGERRFLYTPKVSLFIIENPDISKCDCDMQRRLITIPWKENKKENINVKELVPFFILYILPSFYYSGY